MEINQIKAFLNPAFYDEIMKKFRYILFVCLLMSFIVQPCHAGDEQPPVQKMSHLLAELKKNPNDVQSLIDASITYIDLCDYDGAKQMAGRLETVSRNVPDSVNALFYSRLLMGRASLMAGEGQDGVNYATQALEIATRHDLIAEKAMAYELLGFGYVNLDLDLTHGLSYYPEALNNAKAAGDQKLVISILNNITEAHRWWQDFSGITFAEEALKQSRESDYKYGILNSLLNVVHFKLLCMRDNDGLPKMIDEIKSIQNKYGYVSQGEIALLDGHIAMTQGNDVLAASIFSDALDSGAPVMPTFLRLKILMYYSWVLILLHEYEKAIEVSHEALKLCTTSGFKIFSTSLISSIAYCKEQLGDYKAAYNYLKTYQWKMDSLWILKQDQMLSQVRVENEVRLNESKISRQQSQLKARQRYIIFLVSIGVILVAGLLLMIHLYRRKQRLVRAVIEREKESVVREKLMKQSLEQAKAELAEASKTPDNRPQSSTPLTEERMDDLMVRFNELMTEKRLYADNNVNIKSVADILETNRTYLSNAINHVFNKSFPQVLAEYRVRAAIEMMNDTTCSLPLKAIASEVGFSSPSVFFTTFRNVVGITPAAYRKGLEGRP